MGRKEKPCRGDCTVIFAAISAVCLMGNCKSYIQMHSSRWNYRGFILSVVTPSKMLPDQALAVNMLRTRASKLSYEAAGCCAEIPGARFLLFEQTWGNLDWTPLIDILLHGSTVHVTQGLRGENSQSSWWSLTARTTTEFKVAWNLSAITELASGWPK